MLPLVPVQAYDVVSPVVKRAADTAAPYVKSAADTVVSVAAPAFKAAEPTVKVRALRSRLGTTLMLSGLGGIVPASVFSGLPLLPDDVQMTDIECSFGRGHRLRSGSLSIAAMPHEG